MCAHRQKCARDLDVGTSKPPSCGHGQSLSPVVAVLDVALRDRARISATAEIKPDTKLATVAEAWWVGFSLSDRSPGTKRIYRDRLDAQVVPALGNIRCQELSIGVVERFLRAVEARHGAALPRPCGRCCPNICGFADRHDAIDRNPVGETSAISVKPKKGIATALTVEQVNQLRALMTYDDKAVTRDLLALVDVMAATGLRIGEALALTWHAVDMNTRTIEVRGTVVRIKGLGLIINPNPRARPGTARSSCPRGAPPG